MVCEPQKLDAVYISPGKRSIASITFSKGLISPRRWLWSHRRPKLGLNA